MPKRRPQPTAPRPVTTARRASAADGDVGPFVRERDFEDQARFFWRYVCGPIAAYLLVASLLSIGPDWAAMLGYGRLGTWTATATSCMEKSCTTYGTFVSDNGRDVRTGIGMDTEDAPVPGTRFRALDSGASQAVFPPDGGTAWILDTVFVAACGLLFACWAWTFPIAALKRRRSGPPPTPESSPTTQPPPPTQTASASRSRTSTPSSTSARARRARRRRTSR